jgi:hypothetical protein
MRGEVNLAKEMQDAGARVASAIIKSNAELPEGRKIIEGIRDNFTGTLEKSCSDCSFHPAGRCPGCLTRTQVLVALDEYLERHPAAVEQAA